jgi:hypothetical protein
MTSDTCKAYGCTAIPHQSSAFCFRHQRTNFETSRLVWAAVCRARLPDASIARITMRELARQTGKHLSVVYRALRTLEGLGYLERVDDGIIRIHVGFGVVPS